MTAKGSKAKVEYEPTTTEIAAACLEIQKGWGPWERRRRSRASGNIPWEVPQMKTPRRMREED